MTTNKNYKKNKTNHKAERLTSQKKIILAYLKSVKTHPCAQEIYKAVKKQLPQISLGTVYRILKALKERGEIQEILYDVSYFDGDTCLHSHFICQKCHKIFDLSVSSDFLPKEKIKVGYIQNYQINFYGICRKCQK